MLPRLDMFEADLLKLLTMIKKLDPTRQASMFEIRELQIQAHEVHLLVTAKKSESDFHGRV